MRSAVRSAPHHMRLALTLLTALLLGSACAGQPPTTPDLAATLVARCFGPDVPPKVVTRAGDLLFYGDVGPIAFPHLQLPGNPPLQPYRLTGDPAQQFPGSFIPDAYVDPLGAATPFATNFSLIVCNSSATQSHVLHAVTVKITQVVPYTGDVNAWQPLPCSTSYFSTASGVVNEGGCGGADAAALFVSAEFAAQAGRGSVAEAHSAGGGTISLALLPRARRCPSRPAFPSCLEPTPSPSALAPMAAEPPTAKQAMRPSTRRSPASGMASPVRTPTCAPNCRHLDQARQPTTSVRSPSRCGPRMPEGGPRSTHQPLLYERLHKS
jgi:hypothetical protein